MKSYYRYAYWQVATTDLLELGDIFLKSWNIRISGVSVPHKGIILYNWCSFRCIKNWIEICYRALRFPRDQWFSLC